MLGGAGGGAWWRHLAPRALRRLASVLGGGSGVLRALYEPQLRRKAILRWEAVHCLKSEVSEVVDAETRLLKLVSFPV